nr:immunoglobulin light chain junction region [Macaca mulatta]MOV64864.1 immunoglobulin light chain junction region [Macaca mulatta]MOV65319.1 immunoglobulin light chain junction region [Macaca mulatta]MOV65371.1 immunoglobulin light chain junction region [Macaca mulatta]MOV65402.1 immunoglobulin light chain junction region [Macaca mulatta]
CQQHNSYVPTF